MKIIMLSGKAGSGKDTAAVFIKKTLEQKGDRVLVTHFADLLKYICLAFLGWDGKKDEYGRGMLQNIGTDVIRRKRPDYWAAFLSDVLDFFPFEWDVVIIPDLRFPNELRYLRGKGHDVQHLRMIRNEAPKALTEEQMAHASEIAMDDTSPDFTFFNNGSLDELCSEVTIWADRYHKEKL